MARPAGLQETISALSSSIEWIVIDEIQKVPELLNEVHRQIEMNKRRHFALTGSSARKLNRGKANLLAGRAFALNMHPLTWQELAQSVPLADILTYGSLPSVCNTPEDRNAYLKTYAQTYLKEEILAEGVLRNLPAFRNFLPLAAQSNGQVISWSTFAHDTGVDAKTIRSYFEVLEDTLIGFLLPAYARSLRKQQRTHPKFYFFDTGVKRALASELTLPLLPHTEAYGRAFEQFCILELKRLNDYHATDYRFSYFGTPDIDIDLVVERPGKKNVFVEIKSTHRLKESGLAPLMHVVKTAKNSVGLCLCQEKMKRLSQNILICPWQEMWKTLVEI